MFVNIVERTKGSLGSEVRNCVLQFFMEKGDLLISILVSLTLVEFFKRDRLKIHLMSKSQTREVSHSRYFRAEKLPPLDEYYFSSQNAVMLDSGVSFPSINFLRNFF